MLKRNEGLDALRGFTILAMILSGSIAYNNNMPAWMFHAQVPPPSFKFNPNIYGITWVDLVFPFFLFSMGAAIPLSLKKSLELAVSNFDIIKHAFKRFLLLAFFSLFSHHMKAWAIAENPTTKEHLLSMLAFALLFFQFYENKNNKRKNLFLTLKFLSFIVSVILLFKLSFWNGKSFDFYKSDIIIMVLANMALFGTLIYYFTRKNPLLRIGILPFIMAIFLAAKEPENSWTKELFNFSMIGGLNFDWLYKFSFLKYLFIIIPGTIAGEMLLNNSNIKSSINIVKENALAVIILIIIFSNLYCLFNRFLFLNLIITICLCLSILFIMKDFEKENLYKKLFNAASYLLLLGLVFEAYEGGIRKDNSTYSYYFVTSGLAFFVLIVFLIFSKKKFLCKVTNWLSLNGKNPMIAYVAGSLLVLPILSLSNLKIYWDAMGANFFMGLMKGVLFTALVSAITVFCVRKGWLWKT